MRRNCNKTLVDWRVPENDNFEISSSGKIKKGKLWHFNKNVSDDDKKKYRAKSYKENINLIIN